MNSIECKFCGFVGNAETGFCSVCGNKFETENSSQTVFTEINTATPTPAGDSPNADYRSSYQKPPKSLSKCLGCGKDIPGGRRICDGCEQKEKKSGFNLVRKLFLVLPLSIGLLFTYWFFYYYLEDPVNKTIRKYEKFTGIDKTLNFDNFRIKGRVSAKIKDTEPNALGYMGFKEDEFAFEMIFTKADEFYVNIYRDSKNSYFSNSQNPVYLAGSNGYRHWQSELSWSNWAVGNQYSMRVKDVDVFRNIFPKNILLGLTNFKSFMKTDNSYCRSITPEAARQIMLPKVYKVDGREYNAYECENLYISVQDEKGYPSTLEFDPQTGVLLSEKGKTEIEGKNADVELKYMAFNRFKLDFKDGNSKTQQEVLLPVNMFFRIGIGNNEVGTLRFKVESVETNTQIEPGIFEKPVL